MEVMLRKQALALGLVHYYTGEPCSYGHCATRRVSNYTCTACELVISSRSQLKNRPKVLERKKAYYQNNKEHHYKQTRRWVEANRALANEYKYKYRRNNKTKYCFYAMKRICKKLNATPLWADLEAIQAVYAEAALITEKTGIKHHVDHIIPLQGRLVSGLHVEYNLQIISAQDNVVKSNKFEPFIRSLSRQKV